LSIEIIDRRGGKKVDEAPAPSEQPAQVGPQLVKGEKHTWLDVAYMLTLTQGSQGFIFIGRCVGERSDGRPFIGDWLLPPLWPEGLQWEPKAKERLDTFLDCECVERTPCAIHKVYLPQWQQADIQRLNLMASAPMPRAIEVLVLAEKAAAKIVQPAGLIQR
jgi:hypothetical protein